MNDVILDGVSDEAALFHFKDCLFFLYEQSQYHNFMEDGLTPEGYGPGCIAYLNCELYEFPLSLEANEMAFVILHVSSLQLLVLAADDLMHIADGGSPRLISAHEAKMAIAFLTVLISQVGGAPNRSANLFESVLGVVELLLAGITLNRADYFSFDGFDQLHEEWVIKLAGALFARAG
jgi:hypothetical protein